MAIIAAKAVRPQNPIIFNVTGVGALPVTLAPTALIFPNTTIGTTSAAQNIGITNNQATAISLTSIAISGQYVITANTCPASLGVSTTCVVSVAFRPLVGATVKGDLTVNFPGAVKSQEASMSGIGQ